MNFDLAEFAVDHAIKLGASYADARLESTISNGFLLKNGVPQVSAFDRSTGLGLRLIANNTLGFVSTNELEKAKIKELLDRCFKITNAASKNREDIHLSDEPTQEAKYEVKQKVDLDEVDPKVKLEVLFDIEKAIKETGVSTPGRYLSLSDFTTEKYFVNSHGSKIISNIPRSDFFFFVTVKDNGQSSQRYWQYGDAGGFEKITERDLPGVMSHEVRTLKTMMTQGEPAPKDKVDVVLAPQMVGIMVHEGIGHPHEADRIYGREAAQAGESYLTPDMFGKRIGSDAVNISDDPTIPGSFGYYLYDDEGVKAGKRSLIKNGMNNELLHNRESASGQKVKSNAAARATTYDREAIVRMANTFLEPGDYSEEELIEGVKNGVYIKNFTEWNIDDKRVNQKYVGSEAFKIVDGKLAGPVKRPTIELATFDLWQSVDAVAKNTEYHAGTCGKAEPMQAIPVWFGGPSMRLRDIRLAQ